MRLLCLMIFLGALPLTAQDQSSEDESSEQVKLAYELAAKEANSLVFKQGSQTLKMHTEPLLRWSNPLSGEIYGDVYIWTLDGRPEVMASIYKWFSPNTHMGTELQSLCESSLSMTRYGKQAWSPSPGVEMKLLPKVDAPNSRAFQRTRQMRAIAEQFHAEAVDRADEDKKWSLRALRQPIYRYTCEKRNIVDGAMFAYCQGTTNNPEVLLMLEARKEGENLKWYYGLGRQNSLKFLVTRDQELVWDVPKLAPPWTNISLPEKPYMVIKTKFEDVSQPKVIQFER
ncbi:MAG: hypothetical protein AB8B91_09565 [Rubripirellula sp.]